MKVITTLIDSMFSGKGKVLLCFVLSSASDFPCLTFCLFGPLPRTWFFWWFGDLDQMDRNQGPTEEVKSVVTCVARAQESKPAEEGLRKVPDLNKDDLAQRRIQGSLGPHRETPSFVKLCTITEADLETWERLKVSGKTRCVVFSPGFPPSSGVI